MQVRRFEEPDAQALAELMIEMAGFYGATIDPDLVVVEDIIRQARQVDIIVAHDDTHLLGFATFASLYPVAGLLAFTYVQQVYVGQTARRLGVAQALMAEIARAAKAAGSTRVEWSTSRKIRQRGRCMMGSALMDLTRCTTCWIGRLSTGWRCEGSKARRFAVHPTQPPARNTPYLLLRSLALPSAALEGRVCRRKNGPVRQCPDSHRPGRRHAR
ncbi:GNAT family N-acetyltransferase [Pseudoroseomonas wenyumeiae]